jgi:CRP/FNR family transcriptional regulator, cyclic AMP receptor protein
MVNITKMENKEDVWEVTWKFEDESFETLREIAEERVFRAGQTIFREGDRADGMYLVLEGAALIIRQTSSGEERTVAIVTQGQSFGEIGMLVDRPRNATVAAGTDLRVLKITTTVLELLHKSAPDMAFMMYQVLARSLAEQLLRTREMQRPD